MQNEGRLAKPRSFIRVRERMIPKGAAGLRPQIWKWGYDPSTVRAITYDANGNVYFGFR